MKKGKQLYVLIAVAILIVFVGMASFAYFSTLGNSTASSEVTVVTHTTDSFLFTAGDDLQLEAHQGNFGIKTIKMGK